MAKRKVRKSKLRFDRKLAENIKPDKVSFFAYAKCKSRAKMQTGVTKDSNGNPLHAEPFNNYFRSVFVKEDTANMPHTRVKPRVKNAALSPSTKE